MEKPTFSSTFATIESQSSTLREPKRSRYSLWPIVLLMLLMLICMGASAAIIVHSDGQPVKSWTIAPAILLAFVSSIWNFAATSLLGTAVAITWWRNFQEGTTVRNLHYIWRRGAGFSWLSSFRAGVDARNIVLLATLVFIVQAINNPVLQRSTHVEAREVTVAQTMMLNMVSKLPDGDLGVVTNATAKYPVIGIREGIAVSRGYLFNETMLTKNATDFRCDGVCKGNVQATGLRFKCNTTTEHMDFLDPDNLYAEIFGVDTNIAFDTNGAPIPVLISRYASALDHSCKATITVDMCTFEAGFVQYPITIQGTTITLDDGMLDNMTFVSGYTSDGDLATTKAGQGAGPLQSVNDFFGYISVHAPLQPNPIKNNSVIYGGVRNSDMFLQTSASAYDNFTLEHCSLVFLSPTAYAKNFMHQFMFRASLRASTDKDKQTVGVQRSSLQLVYQSNYHYLGAVLTAMLMVLFCLFSQVWAWWKLGWNVTMSPIETASALGAPILQQTGGSSAQDILKMAGARVVLDSRNPRMRTNDI